MATDLTDLWRRAFELNTAYYESLQRLTNDYLKSVTELLRALPSTDSPFDFTTAHTETSTPSAPRTNADPSAMVLEGESGSVAVGAFVVSNRLSRPVTATMKASMFRAENGHEITPTLEFDPTAVTLEPNEQALVRIGAQIDDNLELDAGYRGEITADGLPGVAALFVLRRRAAAKAARAPARKATRPTAKKKKAPPRRRTS